MNRCMLASLKYGLFTCDPSFSHVRPIIFSRKIWVYGKGWPVAMDSLKYHQGPACPTVLRPAPGPPRVARLQAVIPFDGFCNVTPS
jgi:hypothetical protein